MPTWLKILRSRQQRPATTPAPKTAALRRAPLAAAAAEDTGSIIVKSLLKDQPYVYQSYEDESEEPLEHDITWFEYFINLLRTRRTQGIFFEDEFRRRKRRN